MLFSAGLLIASVALPGCGGARGTYFIIDASQQLNLAREAGAPRSAVYEWTMAEEYYNKAYEEWGYSDFEAAETFCLKSVEWSSKATEAAKVAGPVLDEAGEGLDDDTRAPTRDDQPGLAPTDKPLDDDFEDPEDDW